MPKPKSTSKIEALPERAYDALEAWLFDQNLAYADAVIKLHDEFQVSISKSAIARWYQDRARERKFSHIRESAANARAAEAVIRRNPAETLDTLAGLVSHAAFDLQMQRGQAIDLDQLKDITSVLGVCLKARTDGHNVLLKEREVRLKEAKFRRDTCELFLKWCDDQRAQAIAAGADSNAAKIERLGQLMFADDWNAHDSDPPKS